MKLLWLTDIHLNFLEPPRIERFIRSVAKKNADAILISGDIGDALSIEGLLDAFASMLQAPVYFVLGNHDFYHGSVREVRSTMRQVATVKKNLIWLNDAGVVSLSPSLAIVGHDSWADGRFGDYWGSSVKLNDFELIEELSTPDRNVHLLRMQELAENAVLHFELLLPQALGNHHRVITVTHVPPFEGATWHQGAISSPDWLPFFSAKKVGDVIQSVMTRFPDKEATVFCGHTHSSGEYRPLPNLKVFTGSARYRAPKVQTILELD